MVLVMTSEPQTGLELDNEGYLKNLADWSETVACAIAEKDGIILTSEHWEIIHALRDFYQTHEHAPAMRPFVKWIAQKFGPEKGSSLYLLKLFPESPAKRAARIAGLPKPTNCL